jgi:4-hydroxy-2-oxoheptanedioate aldolase
MEEMRMNEGGVIGKLAHDLKAGKGVLGAWIGVNDPAVADALAREAFDTVVLDMQHGGFDFVGATRAIAAVALAGKPTIVRVPVGDFASASRLADAGASAIIAPMINSASDARSFADFMKFPPLGQRSWGPRAALSLSGLIGPAYLHSANAVTLAIAMIETRAALEALDDILGTPGIDGVFVGPSDLSITLNNGAVVDPHGAEVEAALAKVVERAKAHGKFAGLFCIDGPRAKTSLARGFSLCSVSTDLLMLRTAARLEIAAAR